ncbi:MAG: hypothetical protein M1338_04235, partial [Patescibacteria group bacterium]|nr:hypothetical protein [Patescibacteria group bacterium]
MGESVKRFFLNLGKIFQAYFKILGKYEKTVVIICFLLIIVSAILLWRNNYLSKTTVVANYGGKY